jgi:hypothetical protein
VAAGARFTAPAPEDRSMSPDHSVLPPDPARIVAAVTAQVREECLGPRNRFGSAFFAQHLQLATQLALELAPRLGADPLVLSLAGPLHDLAAIRDLSTLPDHARESARLARSILPAHGAGPALIESVARCIEAHSAPLAPGLGTPEQVCLSNADVLSHLARPAYWTYYLYRVRGLEYADGLAWLRARIGPAFDALTPEARALGAGHREALARVLEGA